jgi:hypothetical protein
MTFLRHKSGALIVLLFLGALLVFEARAAAEEMFTIRKISYQKRMTSVTGSKSAGLEGLGNIGGTAHQQWGALTVTYDSVPAWADDVEVKFYVLARDRKRNHNLLVGSTTYVSVQKGNGHMAHIFIHPNALLRYGEVKRIMVEIWYKGILINSAQWPSKTATRWWYKFKGIDGILRHRFYTPFLLDYEAKEEAIKLPTSSL